MRKMFGSGNTECSTAFSALADFRSRPNGFSTMTRASLAQSADPRFSTTVGNRLGGIAR